jgi:hypothetical protein
MSEISVNSILDASGGATTTINGFTPTVSNMAGRNRIINGDMRIDQRNAGAAVTVGSGVAFITDRFWVINNTSSGTLTAQQSTLGNSKSFKLTATGAITALTTTLIAGGPTQELEAQNVFDLNGKNVRLSFKVETNWTGNLMVALRNSDSTRSYVTDVAVTSGTNSVAVTIPLEAASAITNDNGRGLRLHIGINNEADYRTATVNAWQAGTFLNSTSSTQWAKTTGNFINVTEVQLEEGSVATPFEHRQYGQELALCQRYYEKLIGAIVGSSGSTIVGRCHWFFKTEKRTTPTIVQGAGSASAGVDVTTAHLYGIYRDGGNQPVIGSGSTAESEL